MENRSPLQIINYEITYDKLDSKFTKKLPGEVNDQLPYVSSVIYTDPKNAIEILEKLKDKYGPLPILYNYLSTAYMSDGNTDIARKYIFENYYKNPDYFFAKTNYADLCLRDGNFKEIPKIFNQKFELKILYPQRKKFHISEVSSFYSIMCLYFHGIGDLQTAKIYYKVLKQIDPKHPKTKEVKRIIRPSIFTLLIRLIFRKSKVSGSA